MRLYDASLPDDNTPVRCENDSRENTASNTTSLSCFVGYVQTIEPPNLTLRPRDKEPITIKVSKDAYVGKRGKHVSVNEIKIGDHIVACGSVTTSGFIADRIYKYDIISGHPVFVEAAVDTVRQWKNQPTALNGELNRTR